MDSGLNFYQHQKSPSEKLKHRDAQSIGYINDNTHFVKFTFACVFCVNGCTENLWLIMQLRSRNFCFSHFKLETLFVSVV